MRLEPELKENVVFIYTEINGKRCPKGTAFYIYLDEDDLTHGYLVTCKHVVKPLLDAHYPIDLRTNRSDKPGVAYFREDGHWHFHANPAVDLAVLSTAHRHGEKPGRITALDFESVELTEQKLIERNQPLREGDEVTFIGLFAQYTGYEQNIPVVRFGKLAMVTDEPLQGTYGPTQQYLVECQAYPGNSGAPIYIWLPGVIQQEPGGKVITSIAPALYLLGVVASFYPDKQTLQTVHEEGRTEIQVYTHFGISAAVPINRLREILYSEALMKERTERIKQKRLEQKPEPASVRRPPEPETFTADRFEDALKRTSRKVSEPEPKDSETSE